MTFKLNLLRTLFVLFTSTLFVHAQDRKADSVVLPLAKSSKVIFIMEDRSDIEVLKHYNFQEMFQDMLKRLEESDTTKNDSTNIASEEEEDWNSKPDKDDKDDSKEKEWHKKRYGKVGRTWQSSNIDVGTNNMLANGQFPDGGDHLYAVRPWGSWYVGLNSIQRTRLSKNFFVEWGLGVSWYNFKFENDDVLVQKDEFGVHFVQDTRDVDHIKSKLMATYINASLIPLFDFGDHSHKRRFWDDYGTKFRIGVGPYVGYRIASKSKLVYEVDDDERVKEKDRDSFYLNSLRYGIRLQLGVRATDFFVNYDLNDLFAENKGPKVNAVSFGVIF